MWEKENDWLINYPEINYQIYNLSDFIQVKITPADNNRDFKVPDKVPGKLTENQTKILDLIKVDNRITIVQMAQNIGISKRKILDNINKNELDLPVSELIS